MKYALYDASYYPARQLGVAAQMIASDHPDCIDYGSDVALVSCVHPQQCEVAERVAKKHSTVIVGGPASTSPGAFEAAAAVVVGDYQAAVKALIGDGIDALLDCPNVYDPLRPANVVIDQEFPYRHSGRFTGEDGRVALFCSRGCKHFCAFCHTGWSYEFSEHPEPQGLIEVDWSRKYNYISNALSDVSFYGILPDGISASHTLRQAAKCENPGRFVRVGIEGVSERLRRAIAKPLSNQDLVDYTIALNDRGVGVRWFMIAGLPGETRDDWEQLRECVRAYSTQRTRGNLHISFTAYVPEPSTPIAWLPYSDDYYDNYQEFADWYFNLARINNLSVFKCQQPKNRNIKAAYQMHKNNRYVLYPHREKIRSALSRYLKHAGGAGEERAT